MKRIRLSAVARRDLDEIWDSIAADNTAAADRLVDGIYGVLSKIREFPSMGAPRDHIRPGTRCFPHKKYLVFYAEIGAAVVVLRILYGGRDLRSLEFPTS